MITVALRFDDPSATSNQELEMGIIDALEKQQACATLAVIPFRRTLAGRIELDHGRAAHLLAAKRKDLVEIALHGHSHERHAHNPGVAPSEFTGLTEENQRVLLTEAAGHLRTLFGTGEVRGFVPPWNSYDATTLATLEPLGFHYVSAGWTHPARYRGPLRIIPRTCQLSNLRGAIGEARRFARLSPAVVAVLHHYDFRESGEPGATLNLQDFRRLLDWIRQQPDIRLRTLGKLASSPGAQHSLRNLRIHAWKGYLPWRLQKRLPSACLPHAPWWRILMAS